jgi:two-component system sensor histidine kinase BaeS
LIHRRQGRTIKVVKSLFLKILLAQVLTILTALLVVTLITRVSLEQGLKQFLEAQEQTVLQSAATMLAEFYEDRGGWGLLRNNPQAWERILRASRPNDRPGRGGPPSMRPQAANENLPDIALWQPMERLRLRNRLFLLDEQGQHLAGAPLPGSEPFARVDVLSGEQVVGQVGFAPMGNSLPATAQRFLRSQATILFWSGLITLALASLLAYAVARHLSRPVRELDQTVRELTDGRFTERVRVRTRDEIGRLAHNVNRLAETLESNRTARRRWMADIAHELRTPIAILKGEVEALQDGVRPADQAFLVSLAEEISQLTILVDDLQTLALSDTGALNIDRQSLDLAALIRTLAQAFEHRLQQRGITLELILPESLLANADAGRMRQLFNNLLENCVRYVEQGGQVRLAAIEEGQKIKIVLEDSGPGVAPGTHEKLFDRLYRGEPSRSRATGGSGLGLAICRSIVEAHGGRIHADASPLGGLRITFDVEH